MKDLYEVLELKRDASPEEIKASYRRLAMKWHPDRNAGSHEAEERFKLISEAYAVLSDETKRRQYDEYLEGGRYASPGYDEEAAYGYSGFGPSSDASFGAEAFQDGWGFAGFSGFSFFTKEEASSMFMREMLELASELTMRNVDWREIAAELERRGCPGDVASRIALQIEQRRKAAIRQTARPYLVRSVLSGLFGFLMLRGGGFFGLFGLLGLFMFLSGMYNLVRAVYFLATGNAPRTT
jgi:curved DNA-binding protein CbpA